MPCSCSSAGLVFTGILAVAFAGPLADLALVAWPYALGLLVGGFVSLVIGTGMWTHWRQYRRLGWTP